MAVLSCDVVVLSCDMVVVSCDEGVFPSPVVLSFAAMQAMTFKLKSTEAETMWPEMQHVFNRQCNSPVTVSYTSIKVKFSGELGRWW